MQDPTALLFQTKNFQALGLEAETTNNYSF
jgi:hypothetical protein